MTSTRGQSSRCTGTRRSRSQSSSTARSSSRSAASPTSCTPVASRSSGRTSSTRCAQARMAPAYWPCSSHAARAPTLTSCWRIPMTADSDKVQVLGPDGPAVPVVETGGSARALVWPGNGARLRSMHLISLEPGGRTRPQRHAAEAVYYVIEGGGSAGTDEPLEEGSMIHVAAGAEYVLAAGTEGMQVVGGPSPPDASLYENGGSEIAGGAAEDAHSGAIRTFHRDRPGVMLPMIA